MVQKFKKKDNIVSNSEYSFERVESYNYLGVLINYEEKNIKIQEKTIKAQKDLGTLNTIMKSKNIAQR